MRQSHILLGLLAVAVLTTFVITCSSSTNPDDEIVTQYKREYDYLERAFFWLFWPEDSVAKIIDSRIYVFQDPIVTEIMWDNARTAVAPDNYGEYPREDHLTTVRELSADDYNIYADELYLEMKTYDRNRLIAGWFEVETTSGDTVEIGSINDDTLNLKLIALSNDFADSTYQTFRNEWRNVYSIGTRDADPRDLQIQIYFGALGSETSDNNLCHQNGVPFIQILGLDMGGESNDPRIPDNKVDFTDRSIYWPEKGYLFFPNSRPFDPDKSYAPNNTALELRAHEIYKLRKIVISENPERYSKYYLKFQYRE